MPLQIVRNDITRMKVDAIVNTASPFPTIGSGVDEAIYHEAGIEKLWAVREKIGEIPVGNACITPGFDLPAKYIIHTAGKAWDGDETTLRSCYKESLRLAKEHKLHSIAFPLLASGNYEVPKDIALHIALDELSTFLETNEMHIYLVVYDITSFLLSKEIYDDIEEYISDNYINEKEIRYSPRRMCEETIVSACYAMSASRSLDDVINDLDKTFMETVFTFADRKGLSDVEVQKRANLDRKAFSKLKCGTTKNPSKQTALAIAIALELNLDETEDLLSRAGFALSPCSKQDVIVQYFIEREAYDIYEINIALFEHGEGMLGSLTKL